jgi:hypothetical protein
MNYTKSTCSMCKNVNYIINKTHKLCLSCNNKKLKSKKPIKQNKTSLIKLYEDLIQERGFKCQITGNNLNYFPLSSMWRSCFMHILAKGQSKYPHFKTYKKNILIVDPYIHHLYDHGSKDLLIAFIGKEKYNFILELQEELKNEYKQLNLEK